MPDIQARFKVRKGSGYSPASLLPAELAIRTDTNWLLYGQNNQSPLLLYGQNIIPLERHVLTGNLQLSLTNKRFQYIDPNGANRNITLPVQTVQGLIFNIRHVGTANILFIKEGANTIGSLGNSGYNDIRSGKEAVFIFDGVNWEATFFG